MKISRPSPSMVVASIALFVSLGGTSIAAVNYAARAGSVDGKSAVYAGASLSDARGKLVATNSGGTDAGRIPGKFVADVARTQSFSKGYEVADNAPGAPQLIQSIRGLGTLTATCNDQNAAPGNEDPISVITFNNTSGQTINIARRVGNGDGALTLAANQTATSLSVGGSNTFVFHIEFAGQNAIIQGGVRQDGRGTPAAVCGVFGVVMQILP
ncbi:hypothetical protein DVA67_020085 [Solirubrobacter sp. CPCC 204708]|uniref:Uncharacterized protein n=1 Tax=Solirubrobacter deserti TaxID=2282478 RepID=A0ABT4RQR2_9ACTN|nr:hypothetical protein [Solirubrobacter deserti]MBE2318292.1 hypothetical protein [Solirubrobacter deserti]MDA0140631.1 hypothetical protein [Solirubrobacter deserti]